MNRKKEGREERIEGGWEREREKCLVDDSELQKTGDICKAHTTES